MSGTPEVGGALTAKTGTWSGSTPITFAYSWLRCDANGSGCVAISGATAPQYSPAVADFDRTLRVRVVASNADGSATATSAAVRVVAPKAPVNTSLPVIHASSTVFKAGDLVGASVGTWLGAEPISTTYQWTRCDRQEANCVPIPGAKRSTYVITAADVGFPLFVQVKAFNSHGAAFANSAKTPKGVSVGLWLAARPTITGSAAVGSTLTATIGTWISGQPVATTIQWTRCEAGGSACSPIPGAKASTYVVTGADLGRQLFVQVKATSGQTDEFANSGRTATVTGTPRGATAIPVSAVTPPNRLVIARVEFEPATITSRAPFVARFRVTDSAGVPVEGALVYPLGIPYGRVEPVREVATGADGWATVRFTPTARMPLTRGSVLVVFVRARKAGEPVLAGVSNRRLVQITVRG